MPGRNSCKCRIGHYCAGWLMEAVFCRLLDSRRVATRYHKIAANFPSAATLVAAVALVV